MIFNSVGATAPPVNKVPLRVWEEGNMVSLLRRNGKFCMCRLLEPDPNAENHSREIFGESKDSEMIDTESNMSERYNKFERDNDTNDVAKSKSNYDSQKIIWGLYCKYTTADVQRNIIATVLRQWYTK